jgi:hypothetical protein
MAQEYINVNDSSQYFYTGSNAPLEGVHKLLVFKSLNHLYYSGFNTGSGLVEHTSSYENYVESTISSSRSMDSSGELVLFSIPRRYYGTFIEPGSLLISSSYNTESFPSGILIDDDGEGNLMDGSIHVGNIVYSHGQIIITSGSYTQYFTQYQSPGISFKGNSDIKTSTFNINISDYELNHTLNPTAQSGSTVLEYSESKYVQPSGIYADNVTGSAFQPYITSVGLYNDSDELIAVAKLAQPLPKPVDTELTIQIKLDT